MYRQAGATETAAMGSAQGEVQEKSYYATSPILYNVDGYPTYFMTLKDAAGLVKSSAFVSVENFSIVGVAPTARQALRKYRRALKSKGNVIKLGDASNISLEGKIIRITQESRESGVTYYFMIAEKNKIFVANMDISPEIILSQVSDTVKISYPNRRENIIEVISFDNYDINLTE